MSNYEKVKIQHGYLFSITYVQYTCLFLNLENMSTKLDAIIIIKKIKKYSMCFARYNKLLRISNLNVQKVWVQGWNTDSIYTIHNNFYVRKNKK